MVSPSARRLHVPARPRPCPLPTLLGQGGAYLADQAIQVGLGPAHGHTYWGDRCMGFGAPGARVESKAATARHTDS